MGLSNEYQGIEEWEWKDTGYQAGCQVKYRGNIFVADFWAQSEPGKKPKPTEGWQLYDELYDAAASSAPTSTTRLIGYLPTWRTKEEFPYHDSTTYRNLTHVIISFLTFDQASSLAQFDVKSLQDVNAILPDVQYGAKFQGVKVMVALGGAMDYAFLNLMTRIGSAGNNDLLEQSAKLVSSFVLENDLDGVDLDLECWWDKNGDASNDQGGRMRQDGPHPAGSGLARFAQRLRKLLQGSDKLITAAVFGTSWYGNNYDPQMHKSLDWIGVMTYDLTGSWNESPVGPHSALYRIKDQSTHASEQHGTWPGQGMGDNPINSVEESLWYWTNPFYVNWQGAGAKVPRHKICLGVPTYGYDFAYAKEPDDLSGQVPPGFKVIRYKDIVAQFPEAPTLSIPNVKIPGRTRRPGFISAGGNYEYVRNIYFENIKTAAEKAKFVRRVGCQGIIVWELSNDCSDTSTSIVESVRKGLGQRINSGSRLAVFQRLFGEAAQLLGFLREGVQMKSQCGFSMTEYIQEQQTLVDALRGTADCIEKVTSDTGITRVVGGSVGIASGLAILGGIFLAPFSGGASLVLTAGGIAGSVASAGTTVSARIVQDEHVRINANKVKTKLDELEPRDEVVNGLLSELGTRMDKLNSLMLHSDVKAWLSNEKEVERWAKKAFKLGFSVAYGSVKAVMTGVGVMMTKLMAEALRTANGLSVAAAETAAPGLRLIGITAGTTAAKLVAGAGGVAGIAFGIWDVVEGAAEIDGSKHAEAHRKAADEIDDRNYMLKSLISGE